MENAGTLVFSRKEVDDYIRSYLYIHTQLFNCTPQSMNGQLCEGLNLFMAMTKRRNPLGSDSQDVLGSAEHNTEGVGRTRRRRTPNAASNHSKRTAGEDDDIFFCV